ncbi:HET-domain-containing protein [Stipitochalara longipes BDJ]|nr:HET-domain-containing protein [Stipitochalara longipes BDJ]
MRLLNTTTLTFHEFLGNEIPYYAILSHRWGLDEVTFQDLQNNRENMKTVGWEKVIGCCAQARKEGWDYVWIDSCCIDKSSSAELSESINSMYLWYQNSQVCYAYLNDVSAEKDHERAGSAFRNSSWFTRGWTLQELLAPQNVFFFNREWVEIGTKSTFDQLIASITGIDRQFLEGGFERASIAQKFSWASKRQTLRIEDMAYCLMGLFGVNMPLLYGEGSKAFIRLQLEIMKVSDDDSLFAWTDWSIQATPSQTTGLLANSPAAFQQSANIVSLSGGHKATTPHSMTNRGLSISLVLMPAEEAWSKGVQAILRC